MITILGVILLVAKVLLVFFNIAIIVPKATIAIKKEVREFWRFLKKCLDAVKNNLQK